MQNSWFSVKGPELFTGVDHAPDTARAIVGYIEVTVRAYGDTYRPSPNLAVLCEEAGEEVLVTSVGTPIVHGDANNLIASAVGTVP